jgi:hypothetical protein
MTRNIPNCNKIKQMTSEIIEFSIPRPSKIYKNWAFGYENIHTSGNPAQNASQAGIVFFLTAISETVPRIFATGGSSMSTRNLCQHVPIVSLEHLILFLCGGCGCICGVRRIGSM